MDPLTDLSLLDYLHDAAVASLDWQTSEPKRRHFRLDITVDSEAGYPPWNGRHLLVTLCEVAISRAMIYGLQSAPCRIDTIHNGISTELLLECKRLQSIGIEVPALQFTWVFGDGTILEVVCGQIFVQVESRAA